MLIYRYSTDFAYVTSTFETKQNLNSKLNSTFIMQMLNSIKRV